MKSLYNLQRIGAEMVVGGVLVNLGVVESIVTVDGPLSANIHVELLRKDAFLWELIFNFARGWHLVSRVL